MRPQHNAAENTLGSHAVNLGQATSMRPQHNAAENEAKVVQILALPSCFNEAAA